MILKHAFFRGARLSALLALLILFPAWGMGQDALPAEKSLEELHRAIEAAEQEVSSRPRDADALCRLSRLLIRGGRYAEAEERLGKALDEKPGHLESLLAFHDLCLRRYRFEEGEGALEKAAGIAPGKQEVRLLKARYALLKMDFSGASSFFEGVLKKDPGCAAALCGMGEVHYLQNRFEESPDLLNQCLESDPAYSRAYILLSMIHRSRQENDLWIEKARKAVESDPLNANAWAAWATVLIKSEGKLGEANEAAKHALKLDPFCLAAHNYLGNGGAANGYGERKSGADKKTADKIKALLEKGDACLVKGEYGQADPAFSEVLELDQVNVTAMIGRGTVHYKQGVYEEALNWFFRALDQDPDYGLAHYGVSQTLMRKLDGINVLLPGLAQRFKERDAPEPPELRAIFSNYGDLDPDLQKIIRLMVTPLKNYLEPLRIAGATYYFLPFHHFLWQAPGLSWNKGQRTFDLRLWDDVKGQGGFNAVSGSEWERGVKYGRFNVALHEFAHQVHPFLGRSLRRELKSLFVKAKKEKRTLDYYADMNEWEYFAQGVEAYASEEKLPDQKDTFGHTRRELLARDPDLHRFIENLGKKEGGKDSEVPAYIHKGNSHLWKMELEEAVEFYKEGLAVYGPHPELMDALGNAYRYKGNHDEAIRTHLQAVRKFPEEVFCCISLADDYFYIERDPQKALRLLEEQQARHPGSYELHVRLGELYHHTGELEKMEDAVRKALELDPFPDPYATTKPYLLLGQGLLDRRDYMGAEECLAHSLKEIDRNDSTARAALAFICLKTGRKEDGREELDLALKLGRSNPYAREVRALYLMEEGKDKEALSVLEQSLRGDEERIETRILMAGLLAESDPERGEDLLEKGMEFALNKDPVKFAFRGNTFRESGLTGMPTVSRLYSAHGALLQERGMKKKAAALYEKALETCRYNFEAALSLMRLYLESGEETRARALLEGMKRLHPSEECLQRGEALLEGVLPRDPSPVLP